MTMTIMPEGRQRYYNNDGTLAAGCLLYTYAAGTSAPKVVYQDSAGTVPHANPIVLDAKGETVIYWSGSYKIDLKTALGAQITGYPVDNVSAPFIPADLSPTAGAGLIGFSAAAAYAVGSIGRWLKDLATGPGAGLIGFLQAGVGAVVQSIQDALRERISVTQFGADPTGATDSTDAFNKAKARGALLGGAKIRIPNGSYMLTDFELDTARVIFEGETGGFSYERITTITTVGVRLFPSATAVWVWRNKGLTGAAAQGSGIRNVVIMDTAQGAHEYGLFEDSAGTIVENVTVQDFQYCHVMAAGANANKHHRVATLGATKMGFLVSEFQAKGYIHPNVPDIPDLGNTVFSRTCCVSRQNEWGGMIRDSIGSSMGDTVFESNRQAGLYIYRTDASTVRSMLFGKVHFENNYDGVTADLTVYGIVGNRAFLIGGAATYIAWTAAYQARYQLIIDSQTHAGTGGCDNLVFDGCEFNCNNVYQRDILQLSGTSVEFRRPNFGGTGDDANRILCAADANGTHFVDPSWKNNPVIDVPALVAAFGANLGSRGLVIRTGNRVGDLGALYGGWGGFMHLPGLPAGDPRRSDLNVFHRYVKLDSYAVPWRTSSAIPFTLNTEVNRGTVFGRVAFLCMKGTMTVSAVTAATDKFFCNATLPYQAELSGFVAGQVVIKATGGGAAVVNGGVSPMEMNGIASAVSVLDVFAILAIGMTFSYEVNLMYVIVD